MPSAEKMASDSEANDVEINKTINHDASILRTQLRGLLERLFSPEKTKTLRRFSSIEAAKLVGVTDAYIRLTAEKEGISPERTQSGRFTFSLDDINAIRKGLAKTKPGYVPQRQSGEGLQVVAVTNFKGGSGKTTTSTHLAQYFALRGYRVLAVDLDPQASMSSMFGVQPEVEVLDGETIYGAIRYDEDRRPVRDVIRKTYFPGLDLIPANLELQEFEHETPRVLATGNRDNMFFSRIKSCLSAVEDDYDIVVLDCPPTLGYLTLSALCAATSVLITVHPQMMDIASMNQFLTMTSDLLDVVSRAGASMNYRWMRYLVTRYEPNDGPQAQIVAFLRSLFNERVLTAMMLKSTAVSDAGLAKQTIYEAGREAMHRQTYDRGIEAMDAVNGEIEQLVRRAWGRA